MKQFMDEDFLLSNDVARTLYHDYAKDQPIFDYHCHLPPKEIAENRQFKDLTEIWLAGDHYKWRAMRSAGFDENLITGNASAYEKYLAWAKTVSVIRFTTGHIWSFAVLSGSRIPYLTRKVRAKFGKNVTNY